MLILVEAQKANPPSDFDYDLNKEGTGVIIEKYKGKATDVIIPSVIEDFPVVTLGKQAFEESNIVSVVIPDSVTGIYYEAFERCKSLQKVTLPKNLVYIAQECFLDCSLLKEITLPEGLKEIYREAFKYSGLESISIPNSVLVIGGEAFQKCKNLKTVNIGNGVQVIGHNAFSNCSALTTVNIGNAVQVIEDNAFSNCSALTTVNIGNGIKGISSEAFKNCSSLTTFNICVEKLSSGDRFYIDDYYYYPGYNNDVFNGCSSLSLKERKKIRDTGYRGEF